MPKPKDDPEAPIRRRARKMWQEDGSPKGRMDEYMERARQLQAMIDNPPTGLLPNPLAKHGGRVEPGQPVEEAELMENLGEFPTRLTDQGDHVQAPMTRKRARRFRQET
jgi:hypothetical protein